MGYEFFVISGDLENRLVSGNVISQLKETISQQGEGVEV